MNINRISITVLCIALSAAFCSAVTSNFTEYRNAADFSKGDPNGVVINSRGTFYLNRNSQILAEEIDDVWTINTIINNGNETIIGTSPNAAIYKIKEGKIEKIYESPKKPKIEPKTNKKPDSKDAKATEVQPKDPTAAENAKQVQPEDIAEFSNEHIFALKINSKGNLIAAISGENCRVLSFSKDYSEHKTILEPKEANFIFAIDIDDKDNLYLATGPKGKIYKINADHKDSKILYSCNDRNVITLKLKDNWLYAGCDKRGVLYKISLDGEMGRIIYDSPQTDITAIEIDSEDNVYIAATLSPQQQGPPAGMMMPANMQPMPDEGRSDAPDGKNEQYNQSEGGMRLSIAATKPSANNNRQEPQRQPQPGEPKSFVYKISPNGIVSTLTQDSGIFLDMELVNNELLIASGNNGNLISLNSDSRVKSTVYEDPKSSQVTSLYNLSDGVLVGLSNPAKLIKLSSNYATEGFWQSDMIDSSQPAIWGKLQIDAQVPKDCSVCFSVRSSNVADEKDPTISDWSKPLAINEPVELGCDVSRFAQVRIILKGTPDKTPIVRGVAIASVVPNIAPVIHGIKFAPKTPDMPAGLVNINVLANDENQDPLSFKFEIKELDNTRWIEIQDDHRQNAYQFNSLTVPDGIYEFKATVSDKYGNCPATELTSSWISEPLIIDNTSPSVAESNIVVDENKATIKFMLKDEYSTISKLRYTVNSSDEWNNILPDDKIFDTTDEEFTIELKDLKSGEHIVAIEATDSNDNKKYDRFIVEIK